VLEKAQLIVQATIATKMREYLIAARLPFYQARQVAATP